MSIQKTLLILIFLFIFTGCQSEKTHGTEGNWIENIEGEYFGILEIEQVDYEFKATFSFDDERGISGDATFTNKEKEDEVIEGDLIDPKPKKNNIIYFNFNYNDGDKVLRFKFNDDHTEALVRVWNGDAAENDHDLEFDIKK